MKKLIICLLLTLCCALISGCEGKSAEEVYDSYKQYQEERYNSLFDEELSVELDGMNIKEKCYYYGMKALEPIRKWSFWIGCASVALGIIILLLIKKQRAIRKKALFVFILGIPLGLVVFNVVYSIILTLIE